LKVYEDKYNSDFSMEPQLCDSLLKASVVMSLHFKIASQLFFASHGLAEALATLALVVLRQ
jgi:hypothetical protein